jgi:predicted dehydrogenase
LRLPLLHATNRGGGRTTESLRFVSSLAGAKCREGWLIENLSWRIQKMDRIRVALIGYGLAGRVFHAPLIQAVSELQLSAVVSSQVDAIKKDLPHVKVYSDPQQALLDPEIDLIVVATPNDTHFRFAIGALNAGKHVVVDKPFTITVAEAIEVLDLADRTGLVSSVFMNRRWDSDFLQVKRLIAEGKLGEILHFESHMDRFRPDVRDRWRENPDPGSGILYDIGSHLIDGALQLFGMPESIYASLANQRPGARTDDWAHVVLQYGRLRVILHSSMLAAAPTPRFTIHGTLGSWIKFGVDSQEEQLAQGLRPLDMGFGKDPIRGALHAGSNTPPCELDAPAGDYKQYYLQVASTILRGTPNPVSRQQAIDLMTVLEMAQESSRTGQALRLPRINETSRV